MKTVLLKILRALLSPLAWCFRTVMDAPVLYCDRSVMDFTPASRGCTWEHGDWTGKK